MIWIAGPCVIESDEVCATTLAFCKDLAQKHGLRYIFKASFDKANRTSHRSYRGPGLTSGLAILRNLKKEYGVLITTDVHEVQQVEAVADVVDVIQIPAFLCRQTDLLVAAGATGKIVNVKKGQFMDPNNMGYVLEKVRAQNASAEVWLTERGSSFGYKRLVVDFCGVHTMMRLGVPVIMDVTHSVQVPGGGLGATGGEVRFAPILGAAAVAVGVSGIFSEVHPSPSLALSDGATSLSFAAATQYVSHWMRLWNLHPKVPTEMTTN